MGFLNNEKSERVKVFYDVRNTVKGHHDFIHCRYYNVTNWIRIARSDLSPAPIVKAMNYCYLQ